MTNTNGRSTPPPEHRWWITLRQDMKRRFGPLAETIEKQVGKPWLQARRELGWKPTSVSKFLHVTYLLRAEQSLARERGEP